MKSLLSKSVLMSLVFSAIMVIVTFAYSEGEMITVPYDGTALNERRINNGEVDYSYLVKDLEELESLSDIVIKGKVLPDSDMVLKQNTFNRVWGYTKTKIEVLEVFSEDIKIGDIIKISEPYYESSYGGKTYFFTMDGYLPRHSNLRNSFK